MTRSGGVTQYLMHLVQPQGARHPRRPGPSCWRRTCPAAGCALACLLSTTLATASRLSTMTSRWAPAVAGLVPDVGDCRSGGRLVPGHRSSPPGCRVHLERQLGGDQQVRPWISSTSTTARITIEPRSGAVGVADARLPTIRPLVGKSGPLIRAISASRSSSSDASKFPGTRRRRWPPRRRLCGGILVAMPTAINPRTR